MLKGKEEQLTLHIKEGNDILHELEIERQHSTEQLEQLNIAVGDKKVEANRLEETIQTKRTFLKDELGKLQTTYSSMEQDCRNRCEEKRRETEDRIKLIEKQCEEEIAAKKLETKAHLDQLDIYLSNERERYQSVMAAVQRLETDEEKDKNSSLQIKQASREDIDYLLNNVASRLSNPDILYKLIWSEYIQKPMNEVLEYILPQKECAGIYKITNMRNKKSYIGRSTSVRKRLSDHVKSAIGISTIADQRIHQVMREEGLWNFKFELIEECDKTELSEREKYYINFFSTEKLGYNQKAGG